MINIDAEAKTMHVRGRNGNETTLQIDRTADRHVRHGWVGTIHGSQGATAERAMAHLESFRANTVDARSTYVAISRAKSGATVYTDSKEGLAAAIGGRSGERMTAMKMATASLGTVPSASGRTISR